MIVVNDVLLNQEILVALHNKYALTFATLDLVVLDQCLATHIAAQCNICFYIFINMIREDVG